MVIDNNTGDDIDLFVDGERLTRVGDYSERVIDLDPGIYRVVLNEEDGDANSRGDVDILENRLTILHVYAHPYDWREYDVRTEFD